MLQNLFLSCIIFSIQLFLRSIYTFRISLSFISFLSDPSCLSSIHSSSFLISFSYFPFFSVCLSRSLFLLYLSHFLVFTPQLFLSFISFILLAPSFYLALSSPPQDLFCYRSTSLLFLHITLCFSFIPPTLFPYHHLSFFLSAFLSLTAVLSALPF